MSDITRPVHRLDPVTGRRTVSHVALSEEEIAALAPSLGEIRAARIAALRAACAAAIVGGFTSSALGAPHTYPSAPTDQVNLMGSATASLLPGITESWSTPFWCADAGGAWAYRAHSAAAIQALFDAGKDHVVACQTALAVLTAEVESAADAAAISAIVWGA